MNVFPCKVTPRTHFSRDKLIISNNKKHPNLNGY